MVIEITTIIRRIKYNSRFIFIIFVVLCVWSGITEANKYQVIPSVGLKSIWDDNAQLRVTGQNEGHATYILGGLEIGRSSERSGLSTQLSGVVKVEGDDNVDGDRKDASVSSYYESERARWGIIGTYREDTTLVTDQAVTVDDGAGFEDVDAGLVTVEIPRQRMTVRPSLDFKLAEHTGLGVGYSGRYVNQEGGDVVGLVDYVSHNFYTTLSHIDAKKGIRQIRFEVENYQPYEQDFTVRDYALLLSRVYTITQRKRVTIGVGYRYTETFDKNGHEQSADSGLLLSLEQRHRSETSELFWKLAREVVPSVTGGMKEKDSLRLRFSKKATQKTKVQLIGRVIKSSYLEGVADDRLFLHIEPRIHWNVSQNLFFDAYYRYRFAANKIDNVYQDTRKSNAVGLQLSYQPPVE